MSVTFYGIANDGDWDRSVPAQFTEAEANFSNTNARLVAAYLGLDFDSENWCGRWPAADVKARCITARAVGGQLSDDGMPSAASGGPGTGSCRMIDCGLRPGYFADAAAALETVADECLALGVPVTYA